MQVTSFDTLPEFEAATGARLARGSAPGQERWVAGSVWFFKRVARVAGLTARRNIAGEVLCPLLFERIGVDALPPEIVDETTANLSPNSNGELMVLPIREAREHFERAYLQAQLERFGGNISRTANFVGMERSALHRKLKSLAIHADD